MTLIAAGRLFVGGGVVGLGVNAVSDAYPGAAPVAVGGAVFLVLLAAEGLRKIPPGAPLLRLVSRVCLTGAAGAAVVSAVVVTPWAPWAVLVSATLALTACLVPAPRDRILDQLLAVGSIGAGVAAIGDGINRMLAWDPLLGPLMMLVGVAWVGAGASLLQERETLRGATHIAAGVALVGFGAGLLLRGETLFGATIITVGVSNAGAGAAFLLWRETPLRAAATLAAAWIVLAVAVVGGPGVLLLLRGETLFGATVIAMGVSGAGFGVSLLLGRETLCGAAGTAYGVSLFGAGVRYLLEAETLVGAALIVIGLAMVSFGVFILRGEPRLVAWIGDLVKAPTPAGGTDAAAEHPPAPDPDAPPAGVAAPGTP